MTKNQCKHEVNPKEVRKLGDLVLCIKKKISVVIREKEDVIETHWLKNIVKR